MKDLAHNSQSSAAELSDAERKILTTIHKAVLIR
jgi:hypothetical protein